MAFDFGSYYNPTVGDYPTLIENVATTAAAYWSKIFNISESQFLQNNEEITTMIGRSDQSTQQAILTKEEAQAVATWAKQQKLFRLGFWCLNRDFPGAYNPTSEHDSGTTNPAGTYAKLNEQYFEQ